MISDALRLRMAEMVARYPVARSAMLPCLHLAQDEIGYVSDEAILAVAEAIGAKPDEVESVVTFYSMYHQAPQGKHVIKVCTSVSCYLMGCDDVLARLESRLGVRRGETSADGRFTLEGVECLAACGMAPALQVNGEFVEQVGPRTVDALVDLLTSGGDVSQIQNRWRQVSGGAGMATETTIGASAGPNNNGSSTKKVG
jgi:NADH-quinone oxidoreductase E subunit